MGFDIAGKRVLVTGASSGIGAGFAAALSRRGAVVGLCARRVDRLRVVAGACGADAWWRPCDLAVDADLDALAADALAAEATARGGVDVLVNNAGIPKGRHVTALDADTVERVMRVNFLAPARLTLALLPSLLDPPGGDGARIVDVSSVAAVVSSPGEAAYDAAQDFVPEWFRDLAASKAADVATFLAGTAGWIRSQSGGGA